MIHQPEFSELPQNHDKCYDCPLIMKAAQHLQSLRMDGQYELATKWHSIWGVVITEAINSCAQGEPSEVYRRGIPLVINQKTYTTCNSENRVVREEFYQKQIDHDT